MRRAWFSTHNKPISFSALKYLIAPRSLNLVAAVLVLVLVLVVVVVVEVVQQ
jgi:hypothetical protein